MTVLSDENQYTCLLRGLWSQRIGDENRACRDFKYTEVCLWEVCGWEACGREVCIGEKFGSENFAGENRVGQKFVGEKFRNIYTRYPWTRTCERYPGVDKSYLIMRRTPPWTSPNSSGVRLKTENIFDFFYLLKSIVFFQESSAAWTARKSWWPRNELIEIY